MQFNGKVQGEGGFDMSSESDRVLVAQMVIKMADINSPCKPFDLHRQWTDRICAEFYAQGDEEKRLGMSVSPYMDRNEPQVAKLQDSFIAHIVSPLTLAMNEAGMLPIMSGYDEPELLRFLKQNHQTWLAELNAQDTNEVDEKQLNVKLDEDATSQLSSAGSQQSVGVEDQHEMTTIQEKEEDEEYL
uniref:PDEase domain-containing protein n=1 Tax=Plectus sambesii TaxID=2011161 RepID=A0A914XF59_9BILA